jgi:guanylate kinase
MKHAGEFDYVIMNQDFARAVDDLSVIVRAARLAATRQLIRHARTYSDLID